MFARKLLVYAIPCFFMILAIGCGFASSPIQYLPGGAGGGMLTGTPVETRIPIPTQTAQMLVPTFLPMPVIPSAFTSVPYPTSYPSLFPVMPVVPTFSLISNTPVVPLPAMTVQPAVSPAILETRRLTLEWPPVIRAGDSDVVRLTLEMDENGNLEPTAEIAGHVTTAETVIMPDVYLTHNVMASARLDLAGVTVRPAETVSQPLRAGQSVTFYWSVCPEDIGTYRGTVWFYLDFVPLDGSPRIEQVVSAQVITVEAISLFGLKAAPARWVGSLGALLSSVLGIPFLEDALRWIIKRFKRR